MAHPLVIAISLGAIFLLWRLLSTYVLRTPVDNIPGPKSGSLFSGLEHGSHISMGRRWKLTLFRVGTLSGNMAQLFARNNTAFLTNLLETYGPVAKIHGFVGVSAHLHLSP